MIKNNSLIKLLVMALCVFSFFLWFYGSVRSSPLLGDDGAANFVSMIHGVLDGNFWSLNFNIKWFEGLGQPNLFYSPLIDPFNWPLFFLNPYDALSLGYALRALFCWLCTYYLIRYTLPDESLLAIVAASINSFMCFILGTPGGVPAWAGIHHMTQVALLPGLLLGYKWLITGKADRKFRAAVFLLSLILYFANYPLNSLIGVAILFCYAICLLVVNFKNSQKRNAYLLGLLTLIALIALVLFMPKIGMFWDWNAITSSSARVIFNQELNSMLIPGYEWPNFWRYGMKELQVIVFISLGIFLFINYLNSEAKSFLLTLVVTVVGTQICTILYSLNIAPALFKLLPAPSRIELYLTFFYSFAAAFTIIKAPLLIFSRSKNWYQVFIFAGILIGGWLLLPGISIRTFIYLFIVGVSLKWIAPFISETRPIKKYLAQSNLIDCGPILTTIYALIVISLFIIYPGTYKWLTMPRVIHAPEGIEALCKNPGIIFCKDKSGASMNAASTPVTEFLRDHLSIEGKFLGRAEFLVNTQDGTRSDPRGENFSNMIKVRGKNWELGQNGLLLLALPFQAVPVASSYEQVLDYKYYLLWSRYINQGDIATPTVNFTILTRLNLYAMELIGIRYVVILNEKNQMEHPTLGKEVFSWGPYGIYELKDPNINGFAPTKIITSHSLGDEINQIKSPSFNPKTTAIISEKDAKNFDNIFLSPMQYSSINLDKQILTFNGKSENGASFAILPFRYSNCWKPTWKNNVGKIIRTDIGLIGVLFNGETTLQLQWDAGYLGKASRCFKSDNELIPEAKLLLQSKK